MFTIPLNLYITLPLLLLQYLLAQWSCRRVGQCGGGVSGGAILSGIAWGSIAAFFGIYWLQFLWSSGNLLPHPVKPEWIDILLLAGFIPLIEEYLYRGALFTWLGKYFRPAAIIIITSLLFVITHPDDQLLLLVFVVNIICGIARQFTGYFVTSWICRVIYNSTIFLLLAFPAYFIGHHNLMFLPVIIGVPLLALKKIMRV